MAANSFPRDMDYRQEALQDKATMSKCGSIKIISNVVQAGCLQLFFHLCIF